MPIRKCFLSQLSPFFLLFCQSALSANYIALDDVAEDAATLIIDERIVVMRQGQIEDKITLLSLSDNSVLLDVGGRKQRLNLHSSVRLGPQYFRDSSVSVSIPVQQDGHHWVDGRINRGLVRFVVDTGATFISMNRSTAKRLGVDYSSGRVGRSQTANGTVESHIVELARVSVGDIEQRNVAAAILPDEALSVVLLGNSFLSTVEMKVERGTMTLELR